MRRSRASCIIWLIFLGIVVLAVIVEGITILQQSREHREKYPRLRIEARYSDGGAVRGLAVAVTYGQAQIPLRKETDLRGIVTYNVPLAESDIEVTFALGSYAAIDPPSVHLDAMPAEGYTVNVIVTR